MSERPLFCRDDEDPVEFQRLAEKARAEHDALLAAEREAQPQMVWACPSCGWRQPADRPRICGRNGEPCNGDRSYRAQPQEGGDA